MTDTLAEMAIDTLMALRGLPCVLHPDTNPAQATCLKSQMLDEAGGSMMADVYRITLKRAHKMRRDEKLDITLESGETVRMVIAKPAESMTAYRVYFAEIERG